MNISTRTRDCGLVTLGSTTGSLSLLTKSLAEGFVNFFSSQSTFPAKKIIYNLRISASAYLKISLISTVDGTRHQDPS